MIELRQLTRYYGSQLAVDHIDLDIPAGQVFGLLGPNGAGKSTTLKILTCMLKPSEGSATVMGHDVVAEPQLVKSLLGYVPETGAVFDSLTAAEYLGMVAALHRLNEADATRQIERFTTFFELDHVTITTKPLSEYSKGMRQKVVITAALLHGPRVILLDEPLNGLDANAVLQIKTLMTTLAREGRTIVFCSHLLDVVERLCERVAILHKGRIIAQGTAEELKLQHGAPSLEMVFNQLTGTENLLERAEEFARALGNE